MLAVHFRSLRCYLMDMAAHEIAESNSFVHADIDAKPEKITEPPALSKPKPLRYVHVHAIPSAQTNFHTQCGQSLYLNLCLLLHATPIAQLARVNRTPWERSGTLKPAWTTCLAKNCSPGRPSSTGPHLQTMRGRRLEFWVTRK